METLLSLCVAAGGAVPAAAQRTTSLGQQQQSGGAGGWMASGPTPAVGGVLLLLLSLLLAAWFWSGSSSPSRHRRGRLSSVGDACEGGVQELPTGPAGRDGEGGPEPLLGPNDPRYNGLKLIDWNGNQIPFNEIMDFETDCFKGRVLFLLKTDPEDPVYGPFFHGKQRLFEVQIQGQFKKLPEGVLYMGAELGERMQLGLVTKTVAGMVLTFGKRLIKNLHYSFGESLKGVSSSEDIEMPHVTFPLTRGMDRLIITPPGEAPPPIGTDIREPEEARVARRGGKGEEPQFLMGHTYTMSFHSMYIDFVNWQMVNVAGQKSIDLTSYFGDSSVHIVVYDLDPSAAASGKHRKSDKRYFYEVELVNSGLLAAQDDVERGGGEEKEEGGGLLKEEAAAEGGGGPYLRSGDVVPLLASTGGVISAADSGGGGVEAGWGCVTESKGFCIVRTSGTSPTEVHLIKVGGASAYYRSDYLCNGDVVILRNAQNLKYLSVYKSWWIYWTHSPPNSSTSRAHFVIHGLDETERLTVGRPFTLRSSKWSTYEIGISQHVSSEYGGRLLGLYQTAKTKKMFQSRKSKSWLLPVRLKCLRAAAPGEEAQGGAGAMGNGLMEGDLRSSSSPSRPATAAEKEDEENGGGLDGFGEEDGAADGQGDEGEAGGLLERTLLLLTPEEVEEELEVDVPAWVEMVHRRRKKAQLAYLLRVRFKNRPEAWRWMALRTGSDLAPVLQMRRERMGADGAGLGKDDYLAAKASSSSSSSSNHLQRATSKVVGASAAALKPQQQQQQRERATLLQSSNGVKPLQHQSRADQSTRLLGHALQDLCGAPPTSSASPPAATPGGHKSRASSLPSLQSVLEQDRPAPPSCKAALYSLLKRRNFLDVWFLSGTAADLNVSVPTRPVPLLQSVVARALWETHWREEWVVLHATHLSFYASGAKKPTWSVYLHDLLAVRPLTDKARLPLPGKAVLALEAVGRVHYLAFPSDTIRDLWTTQLVSRLGSAPTALDLGPGAAAVSGADPREAFVLKSGQWRPSSRLILNARRMSFDMPPLPNTTSTNGQQQQSASSSSSSPASSSSSVGALSERALRMVYDLSPDSGSERLVAFLDLCSSFKTIPILLPPSASPSTTNSPSTGGVGSDGAGRWGVDVCSDEAVAFFLNLYHTLLQHALLLLGPPSSKDWASFFSSISYEVGGDVFSLSEMEHCVIRGKLSRPRSVPRSMPSPPAPDDDHYRYALSRVDYRVNFALINGSISLPPFVTVFRGATLDEQLNNSAVRFVDYTLRLDPGGPGGGAGVSVSGGSSKKQRTIHLPKVCDLYRADFDPLAASLTSTSSSSSSSGETSGLRIVKVLLRFLDRDKWERVSWVLAAAKAPACKYTPYTRKCHESLNLIEDQLRQYQPTAK